MKGLRRISVALALLLVASTGVSAERPNVLLIAVDDLNDWVGCLGGHPQARTPNIDALARRGMLFANAHCQSPVCNPSRASLMTSLYPETSGIYFLNPEIEASPVAKQVTTMPQRFEEEGYRVLGGGKLFHNRENARYFKNYAGTMGGFGPMPKKKLSYPLGVRLWDWGAYPDSDAAMPDRKLADWAAGELASIGEGEPFFLAVGFYRPHVPMYAPQKWFDLHPLDQVQLPEVRVDDLDDLSTYAINLTRLKHIAPTQQWMRDSGEWRHAVQSYLASVSFVDSCVGRVLEGLDASPHKDNTIIVLFSDHGFHLGEKDRWAKRSLWEVSTRVPMVISAPGMPPGRACQKPVGLIDLYPTLLALTGLAPDPQHEGHSLMPLLEDPQTEWPHFARTSFGPGNVALRSERYRYIRYVDGSEEFYDHQEDPHEWTNLAASAGVEALMREHAQQLPKKQAPALGSGSTGHKTYEASAIERPTK